MKRQVFVRARAQVDLRKAYQWYESQRLGLGDELLDKARVAICLLADDGDRFSIYYDGYRRILLDRFPYKFFFKLKEDKVVVYRFLHAKRNHPGYLQT